MNEAQRQQQWLNALYLDDDLPEGLDPAFAHRFWVYRNNVQQGLLNYLKEVYPAVQALVGEAFFAAMMARFIRQYPQDHANIHQYGQLLWRFNQGFEPTQSLPYLPDLIRLEWALHWAYESPRRQQNRPASPEDLLAARWQLQLGSQFILSDFAIFDLWQQSLKGHIEQLELHQGQGVLVVNTELGQGDLWLLSPAACLLIQQLEAGQTLAEALEQAMTQGDPHDLQALLGQLITQQHILMREPT